MESFKTHNDTVRPESLVLSDLECLVKFFDCCQWIEYPCCFWYFWWAQTDAHWQQNDSLAQHKQWEPRIKIRISSWMHHPQHHAKVNHKVQNLIHSLQQPIALSWFGFSPAQCSCCAGLGPINVPVSHIVHHKAQHSPRPTKAYQKNHSSQSSMVQIVPVRFVIEIHIFQWRFDINSLQIKICNKMFGSQ